MKFEAHKTFKLLLNSKLVSILYPLCKFKSFFSFVQSVMVLKQSANSNNMEEGMCSDTEVIDVNQKQQRA